MVVLRSPVRESRGLEKRAYVYRSCRFPELRSRFRSTGEGRVPLPLSLGRQVHQIPYWRAQDSNACRQDGVISYGYLVAGIDLLREPFSRGIVPSASRLGMMTAWILHQSGVQYWRPDRWLHRSRSEHLNCDTCGLQDCAAPIVATRNRAKNRPWKGNT
jgi:hypothetical protein